ncbi:ABC transporter permease [Streptomyces sp. NPDC126514]|uniref:ABC transporter permease n=1 Tax=Streptomyces sp. NPDC126514 TaxID=3155210 RepID=UPI00331BD2CE
MTALVTAVALIGPHFAPRGPTEFVGLPFSEPSVQYPFGTDNLGRDVLSRFLCGGQFLLFTSVTATVLSVGAGAAVGIMAGFGRNWQDELLMRIGDIFLVFPPLILALLFISVSGPRTWLLVAVVCFAFIPRNARVVRSATMSIVGRDFVKAAEANGVSRFRIIVGEIVPNIMNTLMVEFGLRLSAAIGLVAALAFLGLGRPPPSADWGLMINENRVASTAQPWGVLLPILAICMLTIGVNLMTDGLARVYSGLDPGRVR